MNSTTGTACGTSARQMSQMEATMNNITDALQRLDMAQSRVSGSLDVLGGNVPKDLSDNAKAPEPGNHIHRLDILAMRLSNLVDQVADSADRLQRYV